MRCAIYDGLAVFFPSGICGFHKSESPSQTKGKARMNFFLSQRSTTFRADPEKPCLQGTIEGLIP
jgi:hypothetical protein